MRTLGTGIIGRVGALAISIATIVGCGDNGIVPDAQEVDAPPPDMMVLPPAQLSISPLTSDLGSQVVGNTSPATSFTVTNTGGSPTTSISAQIMGSGSPNFSIETTTCTTLAVNATCIVQVSFTPASPGQKTANLVVSATDGGSVSSALDGTGIQPGNILLSPGSHTFADVVVNQVSATAASFTVTNTGGTATGTLSTSITGPNAVDFRVETNTCTGTLAGSATCAITVSFRPGSAGVKSATLQVQGTPGGTTTAGLAGTALADARLSINPTILNFGTVIVNQSSGNQTFTVTNVGGVPSGAVNPTLSGGDAGQFTIVSGNCSAPLAPSASCNIIVQFRPTAARAIAAQLDVSASPGGTTSASLLGTGQTDGQITISPGTVNYTDTTVGAMSASQVFTVTNTGGAPTGSLATALGGNNPADFTIVGGSNGCQGTTLAPSGICTIAIVFTPTSGGAKSANITVTGTPGGSAIAGLNGTGIEPADLNITPASRDFGSVGTGTLTGFQIFTISNDGGEATGTFLPALNGPQAGQFQLVNGCPTTLAPGDDCTVQVRFAPSINGAAAASVDVSATPGGSASAGLFGQGVNPAALNLNTNPPLDMDVADVTSGPNGNGPGGATLLGEFTQKTFQLINNGTEPTGIISFSEAGAHPGDFSITHNCPLTAGLPSGMTCTVTVTFTPTVRGLRSVSIVASADPGGTVSMPVTGNAFPRLEVLPPPQNPHPFGGQVINTSAPPSVTLTLRNNTRNSEQLTITSSPTFLFAGLPSTVDTSPYHFTGGGCFVAFPAPTAIILDSDDTCTVNVTFEPDTVASHPGSVTFAIDGGGADNTATQTFSGAGVDSLFFQPGQPTDFGDVAVGRASNALSFTVTNPAGSPTTGPIGTSISSNRFQIIGDSCAGQALTAGSSCVIQVRFLPTATGAANADITISALPGGTTSLSISGTGVLQSTLSYSASSLAFDDTYSGEFDDFTLRITNPANSESAGPLSFSLTGADMALYTTNPAPAEATDCLAGRVLLKGEFCNLRVRFSPTGNTTFGDRSAVTLTVSASPGTPVGNSVFQVTANALSTLSITDPATTHNFGTLNQGQTATPRAFTVSNNSGHTVTVTAAEIVPNVTDTTVTSNGCTAPLTTSSRTCVITVQFSSPTAGTYNRTLRVTAADGVANRDTTATVRTSPAFVWTPNDHNYGTVLAGSPGTSQVFTLRNTGGETSGPLTVAVMDSVNYTLTNTGAGSCSTFAAGLPGQTNCTVSVQFTPVAGGTAGDTPTMLVAMGGVTANATLNGRLMAPGSLVLSRDFEDLGQDQVGGGGTAGTTFTLQNTSNAAQSFTVEYTNSDFSTIGGTCAGTIGPNLSCTIIVSFAATDDVERLAQLRVRIGAVFSPTDTFANLRGEGLDPASVSCNVGSPTITFPLANPVGGTPGTQTYTCTNNGDVPSPAITIGAMFGNDLSMFSASGCSLPIAPGLNCTITATFTPASVGAKSATFPISAGTALTTTNVDLNATGVTQATIGITPTDPQTVADRAIGAIDPTAGTTYRVTNGGAVASGPLLISSSDSNFVVEAAAADSCDVDATPSTLAAGDSCDFVVKFNPVGGNPGGRSTTITASANPGGTRTGSIMSTALSALAVSGNPAFGTVAAGSASAVRTFTFQNNSDIATGTLSTAFDGAAEIDFTIVTDDCAGKVLTANGTLTDSCDILVQFIPRANTGGQNNPRNATITVSGIPGNSATLNLSGTAN